MGPNILIPVVLLLVVVPTVSLWAKKRFKDASHSDSNDSAPATRLTSNALRALPSPPWRVVYEIGADKLGGIEHVLIGPAGAWALTTSLEPLLVAVGDEQLSAGSNGAVDARALADVAIARGGLDDALRRCAMTSEGLIRIHWGPTVDGASEWTQVMHGVTAVDGRSLDRWAASLEHSTDGQQLSAAQIDLAWQTVLTSIGRPDPLR